MLFLAGKKICGALIVSACVLALAYVHVGGDFAFAAKFSESDLVVEGRVQEKVVMEAGEDVEASATEHTVKVDPGSRTGQISVQGEVGKVTTYGSGKTVRSKSTVGSVSVGNE